MAQFNENLSTIPLAVQPSDIDVSKPILAPSLPVSTTALPSTSSSISNQPLLPSANLSKSQRFDIAMHQVEDFANKVATDFLKGAVETVTFWTNKTVEAGHVTEDALNRSQVHLDHLATQTVSTLGQSVDSTKVAANDASVAFDSNHAAHIQ